MIKYEKLGNHVFVTKLAGFEHSKYIQFNETKRKVKDDDIPLVQGQNIRNGNFIEKYNYYISKKISDELIRSKLNKKCILIPYVGSNLGEVGIFYHPYDCHMASNIAKIELIDDYFDIEYLKYYLQSPIGQSYLFVDKQGSAQPNITMQSIRNTLIIDKPKEEQLKIVKSLKEIDDKININTQINNNLEELMQTLYQRWFIEFNFPNEDGNPYKSSGGKMIWNEELKHEIPEGWNVENLIDNINWIGGSQPPKSTFIYEKKDGYIRFIQNRDYDKEDHITYIKESKSNQLCTRTDIMMDKYGDAGKTRFGLEGAYNVALSKIDVKNKNLKEYIRYFLSSNSIYTYLHNSCIASTRASLNESNLSFLKIVIPNEKILLEFNNIAIKNMDMLLKNKDESKKLTELRDFLLPMLMNGQINVDDVEI